MARVWVEVLGVEQVGVEDNFFELGGDSILSIQVVSRARQAGVVVSSKDIFLHQTIAELAAVATPTQGDGPDREAVTGPTALTPIQRWFFQTHPVSPHHFNQPVVVELADGVDEQYLEQALEALPLHHDALRMRFEHLDGQWRQDTAPAEPTQVLQRHVDLSDLDVESQRATMEKIADDVHASFDLGTGPLLKAVLFTLGEGDGRYLFLNAHHLVVDAVSWRILLEDLELAYQQVVSGESPQPGARTTSFQHWAHRLVEHAAAGSFDAELDHWADAMATHELPVDREPQGPGVPMGAVSVRLSARDTDALLRSAPTAYRTRINDVLLGALAWALCRWTGQDRVSINVEGHGREEIFDDVDLSRTVGWFTTMFPVALQVPGEAEPGWRDLIRSVRRQLRAVPGNGLGFGALRYLGSPKAREWLAAAGPGPQIAFNYLGHWGAPAQGPTSGLYRGMRSSLGQAHDPADRGAHLLEVVGGVQDGQLGFFWRYQVDRHDRATVEAVAGDFAEALRRIAQDCRDAT